TRSKVVFRLYTRPTLPVPGVSVVLAWLANIALTVAGSSGMGVESIVVLIQSARRAPDKANASLICQVSAMNRPMLPCEESRAVEVGPAEAHSPVALVKVRVVRTDPARSS